MSSSLRKVSGPVSEDSKGLLPLYALKSDSDLRLLELLLEKVVLQASHKSDSKAMMPGPLHALMRLANELQTPELENGAVHKWWEDWHGLSSDGSSLIVTLAVKEKRLDLLEKLLANSRAAYPNKDNGGVSHSIFGRTDLWAPLEARKPAYSW